MLPQDQESIPDISEQARENFYYRLLKKNVIAPIVGYSTPTYTLDFAWPLAGYAILLQPFKSDLHNKITSDGWKIFYFPGREIFKAENYEMLSSVLPHAN